MKASDLAKIAASIAAGNITVEAAKATLGTEHHSALDTLLETGIGIAGAAIGGAVIAEAMDELGVSDLIDDAADSLLGEW